MGHKLEDSELATGHWWTWEFQKKKQFEIAIQLFDRYEDKSFEDCLVEAKHMVNQFYKDVMGPQRKW